MSDVMTSILTDASLRSSTSVERILVNKAKAGGPWANEARS